jgi:putative GTP pyrophosphokinase
MPVSLSTDPSDFLRRHELPLDATEQAGISWEQLLAIYNQHDSGFADLEAVAKYIVDRLRQLPEVHSLRYRVKDPEHLIAKVLRKRIGNPTREITAENFTSEITDLVGIRALHLFKDEWLPIHRFITSNWELHEQPTANVRLGDPEDFRNDVAAHGCAVHEHRAGYRSIHYLLKSNPSRQAHVIELQVRTVFEEAWSEIDHRIRYPNSTGNAVLSQYLVMFNRLAGSADEMGTYVKLLRAHLEDNERRYSDADMERQRLVSEVESMVGQLNLAAQERAKLEDKLKKISATTGSLALSDGTFAKDLRVAGLSSITVGALRPSSIFAIAPKKKCTVCDKDFVPDLLMSNPDCCAEHQNTIVVRFPGQQ